MKNTSSRHKIIVLLDEDASGYDRLTHFVRGDLGSTATCKELSPHKYLVEFNWECSNKEIASKIIELRGLVRATLPAIVQGDQPLSVYGVAYAAHKDRLSKTSASTVPLASF